MSRALGAPIGVVACWFGLEQLFTLVVGHEGLLAPFGPVHLASALLGLVVIALRLFVTFLALPWAVWRATGRRAQGPALTKAQPSALS